MLDANFFYKATVESILCHSFTIWFGNLRVKSKAQIFGLAKMAGKITGTPLTAQDILSDPAHVLNRRYTLPLCIPLSFTFINGHPLESRQRR